MVCQTVSVHFILKQRTSQCDEQTKHLTSEVGYGLLDGVDLGLEEPDVLLMVVDLEPQPMQLVLQHLQSTSTKM
jgi:Ethanolamine utilization protein EutJ (predicted chaperonin)